MIMLQAIPEDHERLTTITKLSKAYWGYSQEQLLHWEQALTITEVYIQQHSVYKLLMENNTVGYYSYFAENEHTIKLDNLFLLPDYIGKGLGKFMMTDFLNRVKQTLVTKVLLDADPNTEQFYQKLGFVTTGQKENITKDRFLPVMECNMNS